MRVFKDGKKRDWALSVNVDSIKRVKAMTGVNLIDVLDGKLIEKLATDPVLLCDVCYALAKNDADALNITAEDFGKALYGDPVEHATAALLEEIIDFFPARRRQLLTAALKKFREVETKAAALVDKKIQAFNVDSHLKSVKI